MEKKTEHEMETVEFRALGSGASAFGNAFLQGAQAQKSKGQVNCRHQVILPSNLDCSLRNKPVSKND